MNKLPILQGTVLRIEHDYLTVRTDTGWLLWSIKLDVIKSQSGSNFGRADEAIHSAFAEFEYERMLEQHEDTTP